MKPRSGPAVLAALVLFLVAGGCGDDHEHAAAPTAAPDRTVDVEMVDNAFQPAELSVAEGETVRFRFTNRGAAVHEAVIGTPEEQAEHMDDHDSGHGDMPRVEVAPGKTGTLTYTFDEAGALLMGCHEPGHYESGMKLAVNVSRA